MQGLTLRNVGLTAFDNKDNKVYYEQEKCCLPILEYRANDSECQPARDGLRLHRAYFLIDLKPALDEETLDQRLQRDFAKYSRKYFGNSLSDLLPKSLIPVFIELSGISPEKPVHQITKTERKNIVQLLKGIKLTVTKPRPVSEAIVTAGGISTKK